MSLCVRIGYNTVAECSWQFYNDVHYGSGQLISFDCPGAAWQTVEYTTSISVEEPRKFSITLYVAFWKYSKFSGY